MHALVNRNMLASQSVRVNARRVDQPTDATGDRE
jgi:hypothetical protein